MAYHFPSTRMFYNTNYWQGYEATGTLKYWWQKTTGEWTNCGVVIQWDTIQNKTTVNSQLKKKSKNKRTNQNKTESQTNKSDFF